MHASHTSIVLTVVEVVLCVTIIICIGLRRQTADFKFLCFFLGCRSGFDILLLPLLFIAGHQLSARLAYDLYFYIYMLGFAIESFLGLVLLYSIFNLAMAPLEGLKRLGTLIFRWAASISIAVAFGSALAPTITAHTFLDFLVELQRTQSVLTLCLLLFVCFAIRPMGLSYSSRIFGVSLGLGLLAATKLIAMVVVSHFKQIYSSLDTATGILSCSVFLIWAGYFALPEPRRRIIVLPTTSPFLRWNQISQVLGDEPGFVAIGGIPPELFAPAELEMMRRASVHIAEQPAVTVNHSQTA